jgi:hypothetical protein
MANLVKVQNKINAGGGWETWDLQNNSGLTKRRRSISSHHLALNDMASFKRAYIAMAIKKCRIALQYSLILPSYDQSDCNMTSTYIHAYTEAM